jgi:alpha-glucosidase
MVRRWQELLITGKRFAYPKGLLLSQDLLMQGRNATVPLGPEIMWLQEHLWIANIQVQGCQFLEWDLLALISVDSQNNLQVIYMRGGFNWVFSSFCRTHSSGDHGDQNHGHLMKRLLILLENLLTYVISCYHIYTMFWQYIEEGIPKPLVYYDQSDIQTHYRNDEFILETKF